MKRFRQSISLMMVLFMLLGMVGMIPAAYAEGSDDDIAVATEAETVPQAADNVLIDVNYASDTSVGTWKDASNGNAWSGVALVADATASNGYALKVPNMGQGNVVYNDAFPVPTTGDITYEIRMKGEGTGVSYWIPSLAWGIQTDGNHNAIRLVKSRNGGDFFLETKSNWTTDNAQIAVAGTTADLYAPKNEWKVFKLSFNSATKTADVYVDDVLALSYTWDNLGTAPGKVGFRPWAVTSTYYIDYIKVTEGTFTASEKPTVGTALAATTNATATQPVKLSVFASASDGGTIAYQWQKASDAAGQIWANLDGETTKDYTTPVLQQSNTGEQYRCRITNSKDGAVQAVYTTTKLAVAAAPNGPKITTQPTGSIRNEGEVITLSMAAQIADGSEASITYQWQKSDNGTNGWVDITGAIETNYTFTVSATAYYRCVVTANGQTANSNAAKITSVLGWPSGVAPYYSDFGEGQPIPLNWYTLGSKTNKFNYVSVVDDPSAFDGKALKLAFPNATNTRLYSPDLPQGITNGEIAMRVKATRIGSDSGTDEIRGGIIFRASDSASKWHEISRSGTGWYPETDTGYASSGLASNSKFTPGQWHTLRLIFHEGTISLWVDGVKAINEVTDSHYYAAAGMFGLRSFYDTQSFYIDNLYVGPIRSDEEVASLPNFAVNTPHAPAVDYVREYTDTDATNTVSWSNAITQVKASTDDVKIADGQLTMNLGADTAVLVDNDSAYTGNASYAIRFKASPTGEFIYDTDPNNPDPNNPGGMGNPVATTGDMAFVYRYESQSTYGVIYYNWKTGTLQLRDGNNIALTRGTIATSFYLEKDHWYTLRLRYKDKNIKVWLDRGSGEEVVGTFAATNASYPTNVGRIGVGTVNNPMSLTIDRISQTIYEGVKKPSPEPNYAPITILSPKMTVKMDNRFPVPESYTIGTVTTKAQQDYAYVLDIDGQEWLAKVISAEKDGADKLVYKVTAYEENEQSSTRIDFIFTYQVVDTALKCEITVDNEHGYRMENFEMSHIRLGQYNGTVATTANNIKVAGFVNPGTWNNTADKFITLGNGLTAEDIDYSIGFIYDGSSAVGIVNNSTETPTRNRVTVAGDDTSGTTNIAKYVSITNGIWKLRPPKTYVDKYPTAVARLGYENLKPMKFTVVVAVDNNGDGSADWQDAANLYRDYAEVPLGGTDLRDYFSYVSFNFASLAENPFLRGLDNGKKLYNYTDGFGQMILEKGYQAEGHDDSHPDVGGHIGVRQGGSDDFNILIDEGKKLNMKIGIHVNVGEYILDSFFLPDIEIFRRGADGNPNSKGWGWIDQAFYFDETADLLSGALDKRFEMLKKDAPDLGWVYVDIYSGSDWDARMVSDTLNKYGWMNATEFSGPMEQNVVWTHWGTDLYYPTSGDGSKVFRYIYNDTKDAYPTSSPYVSKLLRGSVQPGIGTWQNRTSITEGVNVFYAQNLPSKYMQYFPVARWEDNQIIFGAPKTYNEDGSVKTVYTSKAGAKSVFANNETKIYAPDGTLVAIMNYSESGGKIQIATSSGGNTTMYQKSQIFMPWDPINETKIYYYNSYTSGAQTTWTLPASWSDVTTAYVYRLTATGHEAPIAVPVVAGKLDLSGFSLNTPYVIHKDATSKLAPAADWGATEAANTTHTTAKGYLADQGFDTGAKDYWQVKGGTDANVTMKDDLRGNGIMQVEADATNSTVVENTIKNLTPGQTYSASIWLQIGSGGKTTEQRPVTLRVTDGSGLISTEYTLNHSIVQNMDETGKWKYNSSPDYKYMSRIEVRFTAKAATATLQIEVGAGDQTVVFDDAKIWKYLSDPKAVTDPDVVYFEDFENITENYGPFVYQCGGGNSTHFAEKAPESVTVGGTTYETSQYECYVIDGNWSLKTWESDVRNPILRTNPATLEFKSGQTYYVSFQYSTKTATGSYVAQLRNGSGTIQQTIQLKQTASYQAAETAAFTAFTPDNNDWYVTISNTKALSAVHTDFLVIDNFLVSKSESSNVPATGVALDKTTADLYTNADPKTVTLTATVFPENASNKAVTWSTSNAEVATVADGVVTAVGKGTAIITATTADGGHTATCTVTVSAYVDDTPTYTPPTTTIETRRNEDGSITKTVTDKTTGTITKTTTWTDGTKIETVRKIDGETSIKFTDKDGKVVADVSIPAAAEEKTFDDVPEQHWANESISYVAGAGFFQGTDKGFEPDVLMTRGMFVTVLHRMSGKVGAGSVPVFNDVGTDTYFADAVLWANKNGVVKGYTADTFGPDDQVSREMVAVILYRYAALLGLSTETASLEKFSDSKNVSNWANEAMGWGVKNRLINGKPGEQLDPQGTVSRAEVAAILQRLCKLIQKG